MLGTASETKFLDDLKVMAMMGTRTRLINGDEFDAFTSFRRSLHWRAGERRAIKQAHNQRERKRQRQALARAAWVLAAGLTILPAQASPTAADWKQCDALAEASEARCEATNEACQSESAAVRRACRERVVSDHMPVSAERMQAERAERARAAKVELWLSERPAGGRLEPCATATERVWTQADAPRLSLQMRPRGPVSLHNLGGDGSDLRWTQRCFQLRVNATVLVQGALIPSESARWLPPNLPVLVLDYRSVRMPWMELQCGWPRHFEFDYQSAWPFPAARPWRCP
jgi:hypothetical protein